MNKLSVPKENIRIVLLEGIHANAVALLQGNGYATVECYKHAPAPMELRRLLQGAHMVGIRSRTRLTAEILAGTDRLFCVGCFCIGTNQVDTQAAKLRGIPVFNAPYSNTRSVAELVLGEIIMLLRRVPEKSALAHSGAWQKTAQGAHEIRGKTLGIIGYGHIGSQLSVLAEALGMRVRFFDIVEKLAIGNASACVSLEKLLAESDVVSLHVPGTPETRNMIGPRELALMKRGSHLINAARGDVVDIDALAAALRADHIAGAAVDVFPQEPSSEEETLRSPLRGIGNVLLTPHIGGSTREAQANIGTEVAEKLVRYSDTGSTVGAVNFTEVSLPVQREQTRFLNIHRNVPGILTKINQVFSSRDLNIAGQYLRTDAEIGYVVTDIAGQLDESQGVRGELEAIAGTIRTRFLY